MNKTILFAAFLAGLLLFGCAMPWDAQKAPAAKNATARIVPPPVQENATAAANESNATLPAAPAEWSAEYSVKITPESMNPEKVSGIVHYAKGENWRLDYGFAPNSTLDKVNVTEMRIYSLPAGMFVCRKANGEWKCVFSKAGTEAMRLIRSINDALKNSTALQNELLSIERVEKTTIAGVEADCFYIDSKLDVRTKQCFSPEGGMLYMRSLQTVQEIGTFEIEYLAKSYQTSVEETAFDLPAIPGNAPTDDNETGQAALIPRNVSDKINDGQFRLKEQADSPLRIYVLDAGQADSVLVTRGDFAVLIDEGTNVSGYIRKLGVKRLNIVVATHDYPGAIGALGGALDDFPVDEVWENGVGAGSAEYAALLAKVRDENVTVKHPEAGDWFAFSGVNFTVLNPQKQRLLGSPESDSVVMKVSMGDFCMLLLNPTVQERELALMGQGASLRCDVMTYFRHGEGRPEPSLLVSNAAPRDVIISVGVNSLGLPSNTTLTRLGLAGIRVLRTDLDGTVRITYDGFNPYEIAVQKDASSTVFRVV